MGYQYLQNGNVDAALAVFQLNVEAFPESSNPYDSVAEAYLANGDTTLSIVNYRRSLELNPGNDNAKTVLAGLGISEARESMSVPMEILESYVGEYQLAPSFVLVISLENGQLNAQATGQPKFDIFPSSENEFYWKVVDAQLTFGLDESGSVVSATLHQGGADVPGAKIK